MMSVHGKQELLNMSVHGKPEHLNMNVLGKQDHLNMSVHGKEHLNASVRYTPASNSSWSPLSNCNSIELEKGETEKD